MSPTPIILDALASSCRLLADSNLADKKDVLEFHLQWVHLSSDEGTEELDDLACCMAQFVVSHEPQSGSRGSASVRSKAPKRHR